MGHENEEWHKVWRRIDLSVQSLTQGTWLILTWAIKNLKNLHFNGLLLTKVYNDWTKKVQRSYHSWHWRIMQNLKKNWLVVWKMTWEICKFSSEHLKVLKLGLGLHPFVQSRKCMSLNLQESYVSWQWRMMQNLKRNWLVSSKLAWEI